MCKFRGWCDLFHCLLFNYILYTVVGTYIETPPVSTNVSSADSATLTCVVSGFPVPNITWFHNDAQVSDA